MKFATLEEAQAAYDELEPKVTGLESEKQALLSKRDQLLSEVKTLKTKYGKFSEFADQDLDIAELIAIKQKFEAGDSDAKSKYEQAYNADKTKFEQRLAAIEKERAEEKAQAERERQEAINARLKADAIAEFSKPAYRIRNPEQFWKLYGDAIQRSEDGKIFVGDEYKQLSVADYINQVNEDENNSHHFLPKGGSGSGTAAGATGGGKTAVNPWSRATFNLTQQGKILRENPELAARLKAEAGK